VAYKLPVTSFNVQDLGLVEYGPCVQLQETILEQVHQGLRPNTLLLVEHPPVLTLGAGFHQENLLFADSWYQDKGIQLHKCGRGGDVTLHNPGQLVAYPIFSLEAQGKDLHLWLRQLEDVVMSALTTLGVESTRFSPHTGVWISSNDCGPQKVCAIGIRVRKWVSMHGLALNCNNDLEPFEWIVPCGIREFGVTSLSAALNRTISVEDAKPLLVNAFRALSF
jgi:lipoyl(octanoyl) transferase